MQRVWYMQYAVNCKRHIVKDPNDSKHRQWREKSQTVGRRAGACRAPAQGDFTHRHSGVANIVHREFAIKCGLSHGPPNVDYKFEPQSVLEKPNCKPHCDRSAITDQTVRNNRPQTVTLDKTIKASYPVDLAISNSHSLHSAVTKMLQIYTDFKEQLIRTWQLKATPLTLILLMWRIGWTPNSIPIYSLYPTRCNVT